MVSSYYTSAPPPAAKGTGFNTVIAAATAGLAIGGALFGLTELVDADISEGFGIGNNEIDSGLSHIAEPDALKFEAEKMDKLFNERIPDALGETRDGFVEFFTGTPLTPEQVQQFRSIFQEIDTDSLSPDILEQFKDNPVVVDTGSDSLYFQLGNGDTIRADISELKEHGPELKKAINGKALEAVEVGLKALDKLEGGIDLNKGLIYAGTGAAGMGTLAFAANAASAAPTASAIPLPAIYGNTVSYQQPVAANPYLSVQQN